MTLPVRHAPPSSASPYSSVVGFACLTCAASYPFGPLLGGCPNCQAAGRPAILDVAYDLDHVDRRGWSDPGGGVWKYHSLLPIPDPGATVTLGEGETPLLPLSGLAKEIGANEVWLKYEAVNPTHSWKDRLNAVALAAAKLFGFTKVVCMSEGNHGVAVAAYAAAAGLRSLVLLIPASPDVVRAEIGLFGGNAVTITGGDTVGLIEELRSRHGWYVSQRNAPGVGARKFGNPFGAEGYKTISYEIFRQLGDRAPDAVFVPAGGGDGTWGVYKGFNELCRLGVCARPPAIVACQSSAGAPLVAAIQQGLAQVGRVPTSATIAISIVESQSGDHALLAIRSSGGTAVAVDDAEIRAAEATLGQYGICLEPSSAATLAALRREAARSPERWRGRSVVLLGTGSGLRWPASFGGLAPAQLRVTASLQALREVVDL